MLGIHLHGATAVNALVYYQHMYPAINSSVMIYMHLHDGLVQFWWRLLWIGIAQVILPWLPCHVMVMATCRCTTAYLCSFLPWRLMNAYRCIAYIQQHVTAGWCMAMDCCSLIWWSTAKHTSWHSQGKVGTGGIGLEACAFLVWAVLAVHSLCIYALLCCARSPASIQKFWEVWRKLDHFLNTPSRHWWCLNKRDTNSNQLAYRL